MTGIAMTVIAMTGLAMTGIAMVQQAVHETPRTYVLNIVGPSQSIASDHPLPAGYFRDHCPDRLVRMT